jgi:hypothetical protein
VERRARDNKVKLSSVNRMMEFPGT